MLLRQIEHVMGAINHATVPAQAAASLVEFLGAQAGPAGIALLQPDEQTVEFITSHGDLLNGPIARWIDAARAWREWPSARQAGETQELASYASALLIPLRYEERCYGLLWLEGDAGHEHGALLAQVLAARLHLLRARQLITSTSDVQKQAVRLTTAASVSQAIIASFDLPTLLEDICRMVCTRFAYGSVQVMLLTEDAANLECAMAYTASGAVNLAAIDRVLPLAATSLSAWVIQHGSPVLIDDVSQEPRYRPGSLVANVASELIMPLKAAGQILGVFIVQSERVKGFTPGDTNLMHSIADQVAFAIYNARLLAELRARVQDIAALTEISLQVTTTLDLGELAKRIYDALQRVQSPDVFQLAVYNPRQKALHFESHEREGVRRYDLPLMPERDLLSRIVVEGTPVFWRSAAEREATLSFYGLQGDLPPSFLGIPMMVKDEVVGVLCSQSFQPNAFDENDLQVMLTFANSAAVAVENVRLFQDTARRVRELGAINEISHTLVESFGSEDMWGPLHDHLSTLVDTSSFFIALYDRERRELRLPLVSDLGTRLYREPFPLGGLSQAVIQHGAPLYFRDLEAEEARLEALRIQPTPGEPGAASGSWMGAPLRSRDNVVLGLISVQNILPDYFSDDDLAMLSAIAAQISLALDNARLLDAEQERRRIASTLIDVSGVVSSTLDSEEVLERILEQMGRVVAFDTAAIMLPADDDQSGGQMVVRATLGLPPTFMRARLRFGDESLVMQVVRAQQPLVIEDMQKHPQWEREMPTSHHSRSWMGVPMVVRDQVIGVIVVDKLTPDFYSDGDANTVSAMARQAAIAVENARLLSRSQDNLRVMERRARRLSSMHTISGVISSTLDRDVVLNTAAQLVAELFEADHCGIVLVDEEQGDGFLVAEYPPTGNIGLRINVENNITFERMIRSGAPVVIDDIDAEEMGDTSREAIRRVGGRSTVLAPLIVRERLIGSIGIDFSREQVSFTVGDRDVYITIAAQVALAIHNAQLYTQAVAANRLKSEFLANISHELRTPLNAILGYTDMLLNGMYGDLAPVQMDRLTRVHSSGKHLLSLINDVLDLSRIEAGQLNLEMEALNLSELIHEAFVNAAPKAETKGLRCELRLGDNLPLVQVDPKRIRQVLNNVLGNAIKFTREGTITLRAQAVRISRGKATGGEINVPDTINLPDGEWVAISVTDTGIGIKPEDQEIIFDAFRQADGSTVREYEGTGLGLAITQRLVGLHNGHLWVESEVGKGSTFTILLPANSPTPDELTMPQIADDGRPVVLVIDDDPAALQLVEDYLGKNAYQMVGTVHPVHALKLAEKLQPAVIITDIMMPYIDGWEVLRKLKQNPVTAHIPVIIMSIVEKKTTGFYLGAANYLVKPISRDMLLDALSRVTRITPKHPILVVDNSPHDRAALADVLQQADYPVDTVDSAEAALDWLKRQRASLIIIDLLLPGMSGFDLLERLRESRETSGIPIIVITVRELSELQAAQMRRNIAHVLEKHGLSGNTLVEQVQIALNRQLQQSSERKSE